jgi:hypothetical protein
VLLCLKRVNRLIVSLYSLHKATRSIQSRLRSKFLGQLFKRITPYILHPLVWILLVSQPLNSTLILYLKRHAIRLLVNRPSKLRICKVSQVYALVYKSHSVGVEHETEWVPGFSELV